MKDNNELLRQTIVAMQMHAAGLQAAASTALSLLDNLQAPDMRDYLERMHGTPTYAHYGDPADDVEKHLSELET